MTYKVVKNTSLPGELASRVGSELTANFDFYARYSSASTELFWAVVERAGEPVAAAPVVRLVKRPVVDILERPLHRWLGWLGSFARKTTLLLDTAFLAYNDCSPIFCVAEDDMPSIRLELCQFLKAQPRVDSIWITEPEDTAQWAASAGFHQFYTLPMVHVQTASHDNFGSYLASLSKKRRRNVRHAQNQFAEAKGIISTHEGPLQDNCELIRGLLDCLQESAAHSKLTVPYNDVLTNPAAFAAQAQTVLVAQVDHRIVGFMSLLRQANRLLQCHGGLDYDRSHQVLAYHNLICRATEQAIENRCELLSLGPLNNEMKRRAGTVLRPMVASLWNRSSVDQLISEKFLARHFQAYQGPYSSQ